MLKRTIYINFSFLQHFKQISGKFPMKSLSPPMSSNSIAVGFKQHTLSLSTVCILSSRHIKCVEGNVQ